MRKKDILKVMGLVATVLWASSCRAPESASNRSEQPLTTQQIAASAKPAVVMVVMTHETRVSFPSDVQIREQRLIQALQRFLISRNIQYEWEFQARVNEFLAYLGEDMLANLSEYILPSDTVEETFEFHSTGSGFFVSADGYIITNAHVVSPEKEELEKWVRENLLTPAVALISKEAADEAAKTIERGGYPLAGDQRERLQREFAKFFVEHSVIRGIQTAKPRVLIGYREGDTPKVKPLPAEVVVKGGAIPEKDVAVLKVSGENFFTVPLSEVSRLSQGETVYALGYPSTATLAEEFEESSLQEPTLTQGTCSARRSLKEGWEVVQIDAQVQPGNSGGPILDNQGRVVGIAAFSVNDPETQDDVDFIVPVSVVREFLQRANVSAAEGQINALYRGALEDIQNEDFQAALEKLNQVEALRPGVPVVQELRTEAQKAVLEGRGRKRMPGQWVWIAAGGGAFAIFTIVVFTVRKRRARQLTPSVSDRTSPAIADASQVLTSSASTAVGDTPYRLVGINGGFSGQQIAIPSAGLVVGRSPECGLVINDTHISRQHARLAVESGQLIVYDLGSTNGTSVNGQLVQKQLLQPGDVVKFGNAEFRVIDTTTTIQSS